MSHAAVLFRNHKQCEATRDGIYILYGWPFEA